MTCLMAYHNKKGSETISIVLQTIIITFSEKETDVDELLNMYEQWVEKQKQQRQ